MKTNRQKTKFRQTLDAFERELIETALDAHAAIALGTERTTLHHRLRALEMKPIRVEVQS